MKNAIVTVLLGACLAAAWPATSTRAQSAGPQILEAGAAKPLPGRPFITATNPLEEALLAHVASGSHESLMEMAQTFLTSVVYLKMSPESAARAPGQGMGLWAVTLPDGRSAIAVFTSRERLATAFANDPETHWVSMTGKEVVDMAGPGAPIAVNWGVDPSAVLQLRIAGSAPRN